MTGDTEHDDVEEVLRRFRPAGPPADLRARTLGAPPAPTRPLFVRKAVFAGGALAALVVAMMLRTRPPSVEIGPGGTPPPASSMSHVSLSSSERSAFQQVWVSEPRIDLKIPADGAAVLLVEFVDWLCPPCEPQHRAIRALTANYVQRFPGRVKYVVADWPFEESCNEAVSNTLHPGACAAAAVVRTARARGKGDEMEDWLFVNRDRLAAEGRSGAASAIKVGAAEVLGTLEFNRDYENALADIRKATEAGRPFTPSSTPVLFVNGVRVNGGVRPEYIDLAIQTELDMADGRVFRRGSGGYGGGGRRGPSSPRGRAQSGGRGGG